MCLEATGWLQGRADKLLLARRKSYCNESLVQICLAANGGGMASKGLRGYVPINRDERLMRAMHFAYH
jgi:hypothetical protein